MMVLVKLIVFAKFSHLLKFIRIA